MTQIIHFDILGLVFFTALSLSLFIVPLTIALANRVGAVDVPKNRSSHSAPTTRLGGLGIVTSLLLSCLMFLPLNTFALAFISGLLVIIVTGLIDDVTEIGPRWKFVGQAVAAATFTYMGGGTLFHLGNFLGGESIELDSLAVPFTIFCMVGGMNAFNLSDGLDGLAAGLTAIAAVFFALFAWHVGANDLLLVCVALLGAVLGFLRYNDHPAKLFMGDCGSLALGYVLVAILVRGSQLEGHWPLSAWALIIALPLLDTILVMARRAFYGYSPFLPDRTHLHHRLMSLGLPHPGVVAVMYAAMSAFGMAAVFFRNSPDWYSFYTLCLLALFLFGGVSSLQRMGVAYKSGSRHRKIYANLRQWPIFKKTLRLIASSAFIISIAFFVLLSLPAIVFPLPELNRNEVIAMFLLAGGVVFYSSDRIQSQKGMLHGSIYVSNFVLLFVYNLSIAPLGHWPSIYLVIISVLATIWVALKIIFKERAAILKPSSFELLMIFLSWFMPFVLFPELHLPANVIDAGRIACLQVIPFILVSKIYFNLHRDGNKWVVGTFAGTMVIVALRGMI
jgi:UDP-GlcNAc:undecaprenyl-phosphate GlcNAc-1-phosphate transferase